MSFLTHDLMQGFNWRAVERGVARVMSHCGWQNVRIVGGSGDGGGDIVATRLEQDQNRVFVVQVKASSVTGTKQIGIGAIQEVVDALSRYGGHVGVVASNGTFTQSAIKRKRELRKHGFDIRLWNGKFLQELLERWPDASHRKRELRPYQKKIVERSLSKYHQKGNRVQFIVATGLGKTVIAAEILSQLLREGLKRALVLCHQQDLSLQLEQAFWDQLDKSIPTSVFFDGVMPKSHEGVNFGLYQTFKSYLNVINPYEYDVIIVDEAHHAMAPEFEKCLIHLKPKLLIGMTATPWRGDGVSLDQLFGSPIAQVSLVDGMKMKYLAQADYRIYYDTIDWDRLEKDEKISVQELNRRLFVPQRDEMVVTELIKQCRESKIKDPRVIIFCASIEHCNRFADIFNAESRFICKPVSGLKKIERNKRLMEFAAGEIQAVTAVDVLNEGIDVPDVNVLIFLRNTHSRRIFVQQLGRGLRLSLDKEKVLVLDFVTDIRRIAEVMSMDAEARRVTSGLQEFKELFFKNGLVTFQNEAARPFVDQWLEDVTNLQDKPESFLLEFPLPYHG